MPNTVPAAAEGLPEIRTEDAALLMEWSRLSIAEKRDALDAMRKGQHVNRRNALAVTGAGLVAALTGVAASIRSTPAAASDTPVLTLFREWEATWHRAGLAPLQSEIDALMDACYDLERRMLALPSISAADFAAKYIAHSGYGDFIIEADSSFAAEATALVKSA